jgi:hypothetical protein
MQLLSDYYSDCDYNTVYSTSKIPFTFPSRAPLDVQH